MKIKLNGFAILLGLCVFTISAVADAQMRGRDSVPSPEDPVPEPQPEPTPDPNDPIIIPPSDPLPPPPPPPGSGSGEWHRFNPTALITEPPRPASTLDVQSQAGLQDSTLSGAPTFSFPGNGGQVVQMPVCQDASALNFGALGQCVYSDPGATPPPAPPPPPAPGPGFDHCGQPEGYNPCSPLETLTPVDGGYQCERGGTVIFYRCP
jgi:hypothetical protein